ncbi:MAG: DUF4431 domain-containing protein [Campylobacteraceae bacterium]|jgi:hypothetical protein|nr:DUF4431 domain-containing protein [Campylobacteraceae bacterium]
MRKLAVLMALLLCVGLAREIELKDGVDSKDVALKGTIALKQFYGAPNYGETPDIDKVEKHYFLTLDTPLPVKINGKPQTITELQIISEDKYNANTPYTLRGRLFLGHSGHHHSKVLIAADKIAE